MTEEKIKQEVLREWEGLSEDDNFQQVCKKIDRMLDLTIDLTIKKCREEFEKEESEYPKTIEELAKKINIDVKLIMNIVKAYQKQEQQKIIEIIKQKIEKLNKDYKKEWDDVIKIWKNPKNPSREILFDQIQQRDIRMKIIKNTLETLQQLLSELNDETL